MLAGCCCQQGQVREFLANAAAAPEPFFLYYAASHVHVPQNHAPEWDAKIPDTPQAHRIGGGKEFAAALMEMVRAEDVSSRGVSLADKGFVVRTMRWAT